MKLDFKRSSLDLSRPCIMGILNVTPDSFSDGGKFIEQDKALAHAEQMIVDGVDIIDVGGESTRPGAKPVTAQEELSRLIPLIEGLVAEFDTPISVDTSKAEVMSEAVNAGAELINDVTALSGENSLKTLASLNVPVCLMHMQGNPRTMQLDPQYNDVALDIYEYLRSKVKLAENAGILRSRLIIDPGFGFGKTLEHNLTLLHNLRELSQLGLPLLVGISRKGMIGQILDQADPTKRLCGSVAAAVIAVQNGANIVRVHDVKETSEALQVLQAVEEQGS